MILTPEGQDLRKYFYGIDYSPNDLRLSLAEAGKGNVGSGSDVVLLYCFHYDPVTGKYTVAVRNLLRAFGVLTVLAPGVVRGDSRGPRPREAGGVRRPRPEAAEDGRAPAAPKDQSGNGS